MSRSPQGEIIGVLRSIFFRNLDVIYVNYSCAAVFFFRIYTYLFISIPILYVPRTQKLNGVNQFLCHSETRSLELGN